MSGLPTPPMEDSHKFQSAKKSTKQSKIVHRTSKRSNLSHEQTSPVIDGRHKRVWKACERCRMKKTKCDGESPCKRCKDDGLVCTAGSRKKTEFKQLPRGYAEVLENTQYALIATVQKLYTMIRNNESWELGEPEMNDRGQPVIHDIASKLGCIRPSPDLPCAFPEGAEDFAELQAQLQVARAEMGAEDSGSRKFSEDSAYSSPSLERNERASSSESDSDHSSDYNQQLWSQQQQQQQQPQLQQRQQRLARVNPPTINTDYKPSLSKLANGSTVDDEPVYSARTSYDPAGSLPSPQYTDFATESPIFRTASPFSAWGSSGADDFLGPAHALDLTAHYMRQQQFQIPRSSPLSSRPMGIISDDFKTNQMNDGMNFNDGTIRPNMLDCSTGYDLNNEMDSIIFTGADYEQHMRMA